MSKQNKSNLSKKQMGVSINRGTPKSSILIGFSFINHPFWDTPIFGNIQMGINKKKKQKKTSHTARSTSYLANKTNSCQEGTLQVRAGNPMGNFGGKPSGELSEPKQPTRAWRNPSPWQFPYKSPWKSSRPLKRIVPWNCWWNKSLLKWWSFRFKTHVFNGCWTSR